MEDPLTACFDSFTKDGENDFNASFDCSACTHLYDDGEDVSGEEVGRYFTSQRVECGTWVDEEGVRRQLTTCPGIARLDGGSRDLGAMCRAACAERPGECLFDLHKFCEGAGAGHHACKCLQPNGTTYDGIAYDDLRDYVGRTPALGHLDARCVYGACGSAAGNTIISDPALDCPNQSVLCLAANIEVTLNDVRANNIDIISAQCGVRSSSDTSWSGDGGGGGGAEVSAIATEDWIVVAGGGLLVLLLILGFAVFLARRAGPTYTAPPAAPAAPAAFVQPAAPAAFVQPVYTPFVVQ